MKKGLAVLLCLCIAFLPAISYAGAGSKIPGFYKSLMPPLPKPPLPNTGTLFQHGLNLTVATGNKPQAASNLLLTPASTAKTVASLATPLSGVPGPDQLPTWTTVGTGISSITTTPDHMVIKQSAPQAIQNWQTFNIGSNAWVQFLQNNNPSWVCLNLIGSQSPSQIFGKLTAQGQIYLINTNGILFGPTSQVNVHTLIASALNIQTSDFLNGTLNFSGAGASNASVVNQGTITTDTQGSVFLLGPYVENDGTITTSAGQIGLAAGGLTAGTGIDIYQNIGVRNWLMVKAVGTAGNAVNNGQMTADTGLIGMYGANVEQNGTVSATTGLQVDGEIELMASDSVTIGAGSITRTPVSTSTDTAVQSFIINPGKISIIGLDSTHPLLHFVDDGLIQAPSGTVTLQAQDGVDLESGSSIDVSGLWINMPASANTTQIQLNTVELADYPDQKNGVLKGATVTVNNLLGSSIGNISGYLNTKLETAQERSLTGGMISITTPSSGDVIVNQGASLNFSGGGTNYSAGNITTTELIAANQTYAINNAPETLHYTGITSVTNYVDSYIEGANAGSLTLSAGHIVLNGNINGAATAGVYQTSTLEKLDKMGNQNTLGLQAPVGGTLIIGVQPSGGVVDLQNFMVDSVVLYGPNDQLPSNSNTTYLSAQKLSAAGLKNLEIAANTSITVDADADISLNPGGSLSFVARAIDVRGAINVASGSINLTDEDNVTAFSTLNGSANPLYQQMSFSGTELEQGSQIVAAGQRIDNSRAADGGTGGADSFAYIGGGYIEIQDVSYFSHGVILAAGSLVDVSGGYGISQKGVVTGGDAGSLSIQGVGTILNGAGIVLDGDLKAYSIQGSNVESQVLLENKLNPGSITLHAQGIAVVNPSAQPDPQQDQDIGLILDQDRLDNSGFTGISLQSVDNITIEPGVSLSPSMVKLSPPVPGANNSGNSLVSVAPGLVGSSSISFTAGVPIWNTDQNNQPVIPDATATVSILTGAKISVAPTGSITLKAPYITIDGDLTAPAGNINATASAALELQSGATISATGYNLPVLKPIMQGLPAGYTTLSGGNVTLNAPSLTTVPGSEIDVSGSSPVTTYLRNGNGVPVAQTVAGNPGSISITGTTLSLKGALLGQAQLAGLQGGSLSISSQDVSNPYTLAASDLQNYVNGGFDALSFSSWKGLTFSGDMNISVARSLTLDAPSFTGSGNIFLRAPLINLQDTYAYGYVKGQPLLPSGNANLTLTSDWINATGYFTLTGFQGVTLFAANDIMFSDQAYAGSILQGQLWTSASLTLRADRIYPTTASDFTITSGADISIQGSSPHNASPVYSAGGSLTIDSQNGNIDMEGGYLDAPMGQITLDAPGGTVTLSSGSNISTAGSISVDYGNFIYGSGSSALFWTITTQATGSSLVSAAPQGSLTIEGKEVLAKPGSTIDLSGGGSVFAELFQQGLQGSVDPFQGKYVIVPNADYSLPGQAVYLQGAPGLKAGVYSILPEQYAFLPGAMVVTDTGTNFVSGTQQVSANGFPVVAGYLTYMGTTIQPSLMQAFEVQPASYILTQGYFNTSQFVAGNGGSLSLTGQTTVVGSTISAAALNGYHGGTISLSGTNAFIEESSSQVPLDPASGTLYVAADTLTGFKEIDIGNLNQNQGALTSTIEMEQGAVLNAAKVVLSAQNTITLDSGAQINTIDSNGTGSTSLITPTGLLNMESNSLIHASDQVTMTIGQLNFQGGLQIDHGALNLTGQNIYFVPQVGTSPSNPGLNLYLTNAFWSNFGNFNDVTISASGGYSDGSVQGTVGFLGGMSLSAKNAFTINAAKIEGLHTIDNNAVVISAPTISLLNRGGGTPTSPTLTNAGSLTLDATGISVGEGAFLNGLTPSNPNPNGLLLGGFSTVNFNAKNDITFQGSGSLVTGAGNLNFASGRVTTSYYTDANTPYTAANFTIAATNAAVNINPPTGGAAAPQSTVSPGGSLAIDGNSIDVNSGVIQMASGTLTLNGTNGVTLSGTAQVLDGGCTQSITANGQTTNVFSPGGSVYLTSANGAVAIGTNTVIDVSGVQKDSSTDPNDIGVNAGLISIYSPSAPVVLQGTLVGKEGNIYAGDGKTILATGIGGSFTLDTKNLSSISASGKTGFSALNAILSSEGFNDSLVIRSRTDTSLTIAATDTVTARQFTLTADQGSIDVKGNIQTSDPNGDSSVELYAGKDLTLESAIYATGSQSSAHGGEVLLSSTSGTIYFQQDASIDVSGGGSGQGGSVYLRASLNPTGTDVNMNLAGSITGASQILAEGVLYGTPAGVSPLQYIYGTHTITSTDIGNWQQGIQNFMNSPGATIQGSLFSHLTLKNCGPPQFAPGLEIDSSGNLTVGAAWYFNNMSVPVWSVPAGMLTLRAAGNLMISQDLVDNKEDAYNDYYSQTAQTSWGMTLVAGADLTSSNPTATVEQTGAFKSGVNDLTIAGGTLVYTEKAPLQLAAGGDIIVNSGNTAPPMPGYMIADAYPNSTMFYNVATYSGPISVTAGHDVTINGGAIQSAVGDIDIHAGNNLNLATINVNSGGISEAFTGAIRTTGELTGPDLSDLPDNISNYWHYGNGGNISIYVEGNVISFPAVLTGNPDLEGWDSYNNYGLYAQGWSASYGVSNSGMALPTEGLATMAGGNLTINAGGSFSCQAGTFSPISYSDSVPALAANDRGNLIIFSGGDMAGRFLVSDGIGELHSMGNFDNGVTNLPIEMFAAAVHLSSQGVMNVGAIVNPTIARPVVPGDIDTGSVQVPWDLEYANSGTYASVSLTSVTGDVSLYGKDSCYGVFSNETDYGLSILPPTVSITAGGNINLLNNFTLAPYKNGNLTLLAGGNVDGQMAGGARAEIQMSEASDALYGQQNDSVYGVQPGLSGLKAQEVSGLDPAGLLHAADDTSVVVNAGKNIEDLMLLMPKQADITAGADISDLYYFGHNNSYTSNGGATYSSDEVTMIKAGGDITFSTSQNATLNTGIIEGGPGTLIVEAGNEVDLGTSGGIQVQANSNDPSQPGTASTLIVAAGYTKDFSNTGNNAQFFQSLQVMGTEYSEDMAAGNAAAASQVVAEVRSQITSLLAKSATSGTGNVDMTFSQIDAGSPTSGLFIFTKGSLDVGKTTVGNAAQGTSTGIYTSQGGDINIFAEKDVNVNQSRIMTFYGGNITVWSDLGNINAGKGSKTIVNASAPTQKCVSYSASGKCVEYVLQFSPPSVGSGVRAVTYAPGYGEQAPEAGNIYLFAPQGTIDAGEAGIAGNKIFLGAVQVLNANNISASAGSVGVPSTSQGLSGLGALSGVGSVTQGMQTQEASVTAAAGNRMGQTASASDAFSTASLDVRVVSFFNVDPNDSTWESTDN